MRLNLATWKRLWTVFAVLAVTMALLVVPNAKAQIQGEETTTTTTTEETSTPEVGAEPKETTNENEPAGLLNEIDAAKLEPAKYVEFGDFKITHKHYHDSDDVDEIRLWEFATFEVDWTAPEGVADGQQFTITFPEQFRLYGNEKFDLVSDTGLVGGDCVADATKQSITCTFNAEFVKKYDVGGTLKTELQAHKVKEEDPVFVDINGKKTAVDLPGTRGVIGPLDRIGGEPFKAGWFDPNWASSGWRIDIPGSKLEAQGSNPVTVTDTFDGHFKFVQDKVPHLEVFEIDPADPNNVNDSRRIADKPVSNFKISDNGRTATFDITPVNPSGKWEPNLHYRVRYDAVTDDGQPVPVGTVVGNNVRIEGLPNMRHTIERSQHSSGTIRGVDRASYKVRKVLSDSNLNEAVPADAEFTVEAEITMPDGKTKVEQVKIPVNGEHAGHEKLPEGSTVVLREVNMPVIDGVEFGAPKFSLENGTDPAKVEIFDGGTKARITTVGSENIGVVLTNTVKTAPGKHGPGKFGIINKTSGVDLATSKEYKFKYVCKRSGEEDTGTVVVKGDGKPVVIDKTYPAGTTCVITLDEPSAFIDGYTHIPEPSDFKQTVTISGDETVHAVFKNTYTRMAGSLAVTKHVDDATVARLSRDEEFKFEASWELNGKTETREFTLREGDVFDNFPKLPVGTKVTIKEILPENSPWVTPTFRGSIGGAVEDKGNSSAVATVLADDANLLVTVTNSTGRGPGIAPGHRGSLGWLALLGLIPLLGGLGSSQSDGGANGSSGSSGSGSSGAPGAPAAPAPAPQGVGGGQPNNAPADSPQGVGNGQPQGVGGGQPQKSAPSTTANQSPQLARTGASVLGLIALAAVVIAAGVFLIRRSRRQG